PAAVLLKGVVTFAFFGTDAYLSLAVTSVRHRSVTTAGIALTAATLSWTAGAWVHAHRSGHHPPRRLIAVGLSFIAVGIVMMIAALNQSVPVAAFVVGWGVAGFGMGIAYQSVTLAVLAEAPTGQEGVASAAQQIMDLLGVAVGTGVVGAIVAVGETAGWSRAAALRLGFAITLGAAVAGVVLTRRLRLTDAAAPAAGAAPRSAPSSG
ncbi:MAG: MFS transporter, partial [Actinobacteria bacterium]|nr:MFS transporter [Actinomycetota bacterium]